jgi:hypothetical protein
MNTRNRRRRGIAALLAVVTASAAFAATAPVTMAETPDMTVEKVMVNKLGGVSVVGSVDCTDLATQVREAGFDYVDENDQWQFLEPVGEGVQINAYANSDNYTVSQPAGRRGMISVTHGSSRMSPCYVEFDDPGDDYDPPCADAGAPCTWVTDHYAYFSTTPLFDYSQDGKFKAGTVAVSAESIGAFVEVVTVDGSGAVTSRDGYFAPEGWYAYTSTTLRAVMYR